MLETEQPTKNSRDSEEIIIREEEEENEEEEELQLEEEQIRLYYEIRKAIPTLEQIEEEINLEERIDLIDLEEPEGKASKEEEEKEVIKEEHEKKIKFAKSDSIIFESHTILSSISYEELPIFDSEIELQKFEKVKKPKAEISDLVFLTSGLKKVSSIWRQSLRKSSRLSIVEGKNVTLSILNPLINDAVTMAIKKMHKDEIKMNLSRDKLTERIFDLQSLIIRAQIENKLLSKAVTNYMKYKKNLRALSPEPKYNNDFMRQKYRTNLSKLDDILGRIDQLNKDHNDEILKQNEICEEKYKKNLVLMMELETLIRQTSYKCFNLNSGQALPQEYVDKAISNLKRFNSEISYFQNKVILIGHTVSTLKEKVDSFTNIHSNIKLQQFESLQAEINLLQGKIEGGENPSDVINKLTQRKKTGSLDFNALKQHFKNICHILSHARERTQALEIDFQKHLPMLVEARQKQKIIRKKLQFLKSKRDRLRLYYAKQNYKCGLVNKPFLLKDYDNLEIKIENTLENVNRLENEKKQLKNLIDKLNTKYFSGKENNNLLK